MRPFLFPKLLFVLVSLPGLALAGGPIVVGGPATTIDGQPFVWDLSQGPIQYRVDAGPLSVNPSGTVIIDNAAGIQRVQALFQIWSSVPTTAIRYNYAGPLLPAGSFAGGDLSTAQQFNDIAGSCDSGQQNPIIFDADGSLFEALMGDSLVIGFAGPCAINSSGKIVSGLAALNGRFLDGVNDGKRNFELPPDGFDAAMVHEFGHFSGLDHSQINVNCLHYGCSSFAEHQGIPTMFPFLVDLDQKTLSIDDQAWISKLYPAANVAASYGAISGRVFFSDAKTPAQGVNVIARSVDNPGVVAVSAVSGFRFTANPGQSVTANYLPCAPPTQCRNGFADNNVGGSQFGSRDPALIGYYEMLVPAGRYTVEVESIDPLFASGSSVGPLRHPVAIPGGIPRFWKSSMTDHDDPYASEPLSVPAGGTVPNINFILEGTDPAFDWFEDSGHSQLFSPFDQLLTANVEVLS